MYVRLDRVVGWIILVSSLVGLGWGVVWFVTYLPDWIDRHDLMQVPFIVWYTSLNTAVDIAVLIVFGIALIYFGRKI